MPSISPYVRLDADAQQKPYQWQWRLLFIIGLLVSAAIALASSFRTGSWPSSAPTRLWTWSSAWSGATTRAESAVSETSSAVQHFNSTRAEHEAAHAWSRAVAGAETALNTSMSVAEQAFNKTTSAVQHFNGTRAAYDGERWAEGTYVETRRCLSKIATGVKSAANKTSLAVQEFQRRAEAYGAKQVVDHYVEGAAESLRANATNYTYSISPCCLEAIELSAAVAASSVLPAVLVRVLGFTSRGVEAKSLASLWQRTIGTVKKGSTFAKAQSAGATGALVKSALVVTGKEAIAASAFCSALCLH
eukprot:TRINITY_DN63039_c0_g1_i1.p1 TRINITY_DN63039_c0_g1~~TRINITY_DN63039_c0_g1_i1.p1  ORF type:complete len:304 (+),score=50.86 TRINITY_DN63039_c0_g1_i1:86-997(+)